MDEVVINAVCTCSASPTQYEGDINGLQFYFRYRWGKWSVEFYEDGKTVEYSRQVGGEYDGAMDESEVLKILEGCYFAYQIGAR